MVAAGIEAIPSTAAATPAGSGIDFRKVVAPVEPFLARVAARLEQQVQAFEPEIVSYAHYALTNQGKQLRPALVALSAAAFGPADDDLVTVAAIIEMVHLATLVHDDIMDEAAIRRRRPTLAANWGNQVSVLVGDCLFAHALKLAAGFPTTEVCRAVSEATRTVCSGEILQTHRQGRLEVSREEYFRILQMKTATLFALSCDLGSWLAGATTVQRAALGQFGLALGTAYQVYDDCLDIFGSETTVGKSLGTDLANGKFTLPVLLAMERATPEASRRLQELILNWEPGKLASLRAILDSCGTLAEAKAVIAGLFESARRHLAGLGTVSGLRGLQDLTKFLEEQTAALGIP